MKLNLGCGMDRLEGFVGVDIVPGPAVGMVSTVDSLPIEAGLVEEILSEHLLEHLTFDEAKRALVEWFRVLCPGGKITIECPDILGLCKQFVEANEYERYWSNAGYWSLIQCIYGHQRGKSKAEHFGQIHKSGYTVEHLSFLLRGVGFSRISEEVPRYEVPQVSVLRLSAYK